MKKGIIYALITAVLFVTLEPVSKLVAGEINPYAITFWRFAIGAVILLFPAVVKIKKIHITLKELGIMTILGILFICISMTALQIGVQKADTPSLIAIVFSSNSIFTILFAALILKEKITKNKIIALILGVTGVLVCTDFSAATNIESVLYGGFAALSFSLYTVLSQKFVKRLGGIIQTSIVFMTGSIIMLIALLVLKIDITPDVSSGNILAVMLYLGVFVTGVGYACYFKAIEKGGPIMASLAFFIKPILTPFVTLIVNGVALDIKVFVAAGCIVAASYFAIYKKNM